MSTNFFLSSTVQSYPTHLPYQEIKEKILGVRYELSLVFIGKTRAQSLNEAYRQKTYSPNVLSFPLEKSSGEIFICPQVAQREASKFDLSRDGYIAYLFIHGCLHLKGLDHGATMESRERALLKTFNIS